MIRYARLWRDFTAVQTAERAGIARTTLVKIEKDDELGRKLQDAKLEVKKRASKK